MNCTEARERFSDVVDERLAPAERAALQAHLDGCPACRAELDRFRATVSLVRGLGPGRAPAGFAARVVEAARPRVIATPPWWRRLADHVLFPLPVKLPVEAAAILLVGVGVAYLFQRTPELQRAARVEAPATVERATPPAQPTAPAPPPPSVPGYQAEKAEADPGKAKQHGFALKEEARTGASRADTALRAQSAEPPPTTPSKVDTAPTPPMTGAPSGVPTAPPAMAQAPAPPRAPVVASPPAAATAPAPSPQPPVAARAAPDEPRRILRDTARATDQPSQRAEPPPRAAAPPPGTRAPAIGAAPSVVERLAKRSAAPNVTGALTVASRANAESELRELVTRHRGQVVASRAEADTTVVEARVPREQYAAFVAALDAIGRWRVDREPGELPADVDITLRLAE